MKILEWLLHGRYKRDFPAWAESQCQAALGQAEELVKSTGRKVKRRSLKVVFVSGEKKFANGWGFIDGKGYVIGVCAKRGRVVMVGHDPQAFGQAYRINYDVLLHEMVHHVLIASGYGPEHHPDFDALVPYWRWARQVTGKTRMADLDGRALL